MALTESSMVALGTPLPDFRLPDTDGTYYSSDDFLDRPLLVMFICNHCPFVKHVIQELVKLAQDFQPQGVAVVAINSNDVSAHPADSPEQMVHESEERGYYFPYLYDETQEVAAAYKAACTPDFYVFDKNQKLVYRGQFDSSRPNSGIPVTGGDLRRERGRLARTTEARAAGRRPAQGVALAVGDRDHRVVERRVHVADGVDDDGVHPAAAEPLPGPEVRAAGGADHPGRSPYRLGFGCGPL